jgi:uncharacterized membrane protein
MPLSFLYKLAALAGAMLLPLWVLLLWRSPISADLIFYSTILDLFSKQFWAGEVYPRWLMDINLGFGSPVFLFYGPLPYYIGSLFEFLAGLDPQGWFRASLTMMLALIVGGITCFRWLKQHMSPEKAEKAALLYVCFPYLLPIIYMAFSISQLWAIALFPFLLEAADDVVRKNWRGVWKWSLAYALLALTHMPSLLVFSFIPVCYVIAFSPSGRRFANTLWAAIGSALAALLAAFYLLPMMASRAFMNTGHYLEQKFYYANNFLDFYFALGVMLVLAPLAGMYMDSRKQPLTPHMRFWLLMIGICLFMATPLSLPIWNAFTLLQYLSYPVRFFCAMLPGAVYLCVLWWSSLRNRHLLWGAYIIFINSMLILSFHMFFPADPDNKYSFAWKDQLVPFSEYNTEWMQKEGIDTLAILPESLSGLPQQKILRGKGNVVIKDWQPRRISLSTEITSTDATVQLRRFYFPGWQSDTPNVTIEEYHALMIVRLPQGKHDITLTQRWFPGEREGLAISALALLIWLGLWVGMIRRSSLPPY